MYTINGVMACCALHTAEKLEESTVWLRQKLAEGVIDPERAYVSRWNPETKTVEYLVGKAFEWT